MHSKMYGRRNASNPPIRSYCIVWTHSWMIKDRHPQQSDRIKMPYRTVRPTVSGDINSVNATAAASAGCVGDGISGTLSNRMRSGDETPTALASANWEFERGMPE